jgi:sulfite reductase (ferredoxin)
VSRSGLLVSAALPGECLTLVIPLTAGELSTRQLRAVGCVSARYAGDAVDITDRQDVQFSPARTQDLPMIRARLQAVGLTAQTGADTQRTFVGSPVAGIAADEIVDSTPALSAIRDRWGSSTEFSGMPAAFRTSVSGSPRQDVLHEASDVSFLGVRHPVLGPGFDIWIGGGPPAGHALAGRLGAFVASREAPEAWAAVVRLFRDYGYQRPGGQQSLWALVADWGMARFRRCLEAEYLLRPLADCPAPAPSAGPRDHVGVHPQRDGRCYLGVTRTAGWAGGTTLWALADLTEKHGSARVRTTPYQRLVILDIPPAQVESLCDELERIGLTARPALYRRRTRARAHRYAPELSRRRYLSRASLI